MFLGQCSTVTVALYNFCSKLTKTRKCTWPACQRDWEVFDIINRRLCDTYINKTMNKDTLSDVEEVEKRIAYYIMVLIKNK